MTHSSFQNGYALLIGVGADLPVTVRDATALYDVLVNPNKGAYSTKQVQLLTEIKASRQSILNAFNELIDQSSNNPDATIIIYYSGHGGRIERVNKPDEYYLIPHGYIPDQRFETAISGQEFTDKIEALKAKKLVVFLDCCHAAGVPALKNYGELFVKSPMPPHLVDILEKGSGRVVITSSHEKEYSYTGTPYSVFTSCLLDALTGKATIDEDGFARILDVLIYLFKNVPERAPGPQHPFVKKVLDLDDNFALCYYAGGNKYASGEVSGDKQVSVDDHLFRELSYKSKQSFKELYDLLTQKITYLRKAHIIETDAAVRFRLEKQIEEAEQEHKAIKRQFDKHNNEALSETKDNTLAQVTSSAELYFNDLSLVPMSRDALEALASARRKGEKDGIISSVHLFLGFLSISNSLLSQVINQSGDDIVYVETKIRKSIRKSLDAEDILVTSTLKETIAEALMLAKYSGSLPSQIHFLTSLFRNSQRFCRYLNIHGFKVSEWQDALEKEFSKGVYTPYVDQE